MYSFIAFLLTGIEVAATIVGYVMQSPSIFYNTVAYGSPFYLLQHAVGPDSFIHETNPIYIGFMVFHIIKYLMIIQSQRRDEPNMRRRFAILFEALYLGVSGYYLF